MKHFLRTLLLLTLVGYTHFVSGQTGSCTVTDLVIQNIQLVPGTTCTYTFDVGFTIEKNKYIFFQTYVETNALVQDNPSPYPDYWDCQNGTTSHQGAGPDAPTRATIGNPLLNVAIHNERPNDPDGPVTLVAYLPDLSDPSLIRGVEADTDVAKFDINGLTRISITGLQVTLPPELCGGPFVAVTDFFATNADRNPNNPNSNLPIQCVSCGIRTAVGFYSVSGILLACPGNLVQYTIGLTNNTSEQLTGTYQLFADVNLNGTYTAGVDVLVTPTTAETFTLAAGPGVTTNITGSFVNPFGTSVPPLILVTTLTNTLGAGASTYTLLPETQCVVTPVKMKSFTATRKHQDVELVWETASEDNNRGFFVQSNTGGGWKDLGFVASKAHDGNSSDVLAYTYTDLNNTSRGVTQYRIMQVDIDGKSKLSEVRQVRGLAQAGKVTIYPNPSAEGRVNVVFEDSKAAWNVSVADMNGRTIRQFKGVTNSLLVDNLLPGMYMIRIVDAQTGAQTAEKVIINNH